MRIIRRSEQTFPKTGSKKMAPLKEAMLVQRVTQTGFSFIKTMIRTCNQSPLAFALGETVCTKSEKEKELRELCKSRFSPTKEKNEPSTQGVLPVDVVSHNTFPQDLWDHTVTFSRPDDILLPPISSIRLLENKAVYIALCNLGISQMKERNPDAPASSRVSQLKALVARLKKPPIRPHLVHTLKGHTNDLFDIAISPDGKTLASAADRTVKLWDLDKGTCLHTLRGHLSLIKHTAFSPDGKTLASASADCTVRLWDLATDTCLHTLRGHISWVEHVAISPDGKTLASADIYGTVKLWDLATGTCLHTLRGFEVTFSPDGKTLASVFSTYFTETDHTVNVYDMVTGTLLHTLEGHTDWINHTAFSPDGTKLTSASTDGTVRLWDLATGALLHTLSQVNPRAISPDGTTIASISDFNSKVIQIWDLVTGTLLHTLTGHTTDWGIRAAFSPDGKTLVSIANFDTVKLWNLATGELLYTFSGRTTDRLHYYFTFSSDGTKLASTSKEDGKVRIYELYSKKVHLELIRDTLDLLEETQQSQICEGVAYQVLTEELEQLEKGKLGRALSRAQAVAETAAVIAAIRFTTRFI